ncbi:hypothetical protein HYX18_02265 [Candidatus Woesearchaeota archaeon]|nr:hypothetical protein [Candidatus Woesearchaeota archaeon]
MDTIRVILIWGFVIIVIKYILSEAFKFFISQGYNSAQIFSAFIIFLAVIVSYIMLGVKKK